MKLNETVKELIALMVLAYLKDDELIPNQKITFKEEYGKQFWEIMLSYDNNYWSKPIRVDLLSTMEVVMQEIIEVREEMKMLKKH